MISVLYVDDEVQLLEIGRLFLEMSGEFHVDTTVSAEAALKAIKIRQYDALVSDYQMPMMDGVELLKTIRNSGNNLPFILFTGRGREEVVIQALNEGADFYLQKGGSSSAQFTELGHKIRIAVERRRSREALGEVNKKYSVLFEKAPYAISLTRVSDGTYVHVNQAWSDLFGIPPEEAVGKTIAELGISRNPDIRSQLYAEFLKSGSIKNREITTYRTKKSEFAVLSVNLEGLELAGEQYVFTSAIDITERKKAEEAVRRSDTIFHAFMDNSQFIAWMKDDAGRYVYLNRPCEERFGITTEDWEGKTDLEVWPPEIAREFRNNDRQVLETGKSLEIVEHTRDPDGRDTRWWNIKFPVRTPSGRTYVGGMGFDISRRRDPPSR